MYWVLNGTLRSVEGLMAKCKMISQTEQPGSTPSSLLIKKKIQEKLQASKEEGKGSRKSNKGHSFLIELF